jgi:hypothetical protein
MEGVLCANCMDHIPEPTVCNGVQDLPIGVIQFCILRFNCMLSSQERFCLIQCYSLHPLMKCSVNTLWGQKVLFSDSSFFSHSLLFLIRPQEIILFFQRERITDFCVQRSSTDSTFFK